MPEEYLWLLAYMCDLKSRSPCPFRFKLVGSNHHHPLESPMFSPMFIHPESLRRILSFAHHWQFHIPKSTRLARLWVTSCCSMYSPFSKQCGFTLDSSLISFFLQSTINTGQHVHPIRLRFGIIEEAYITEPQTVKTDEQTTLFLKLSWIHWHQESP